MSHRTQITLSDAQYQRLRTESKRSGMPLAELVRRAVDQCYGVMTIAEKLHAVRESAGIWKDRDFDGAEYVERMRRGMAHRLSDMQ